MPRIHLGPAQALRNSTSIKFDFTEEGIRKEGFIARHNDLLVCYENLCRHLPVTLDYGDSRFFTRNGRFLFCQSHGAAYDPASGKCVRGPCQGAFLRPLPCGADDQGQLWVDLPD